MKITITKGNRVHTMDEEYEVTDADGTPNVPLNRIVDAIMHEYSPAFGHPLAFAAYELGTEIGAEVEIEGLVLAEPGVIY